MSLKICSSLISPALTFRNGVFSRTALQSSVGLFASNHFQNSVPPMSPWQGNAQVRHFAKSPKIDHEFDLFGLFESIKYTRIKIDSWKADAAYGEHLIKNCYKYRIERYLKEGGDPHIRDDEGNNLMHMAAAAQDRDLCIMLACWGVVPWAKNNKGELPSDLFPENVGRRND